MSEYPSQNPRIPVSDDSWILTSTETVLRCFVELLRAFFPVAKAMVPEVLAVLSDCICQVAPPPSIHPLTSPAPHQAGPAMAWLAGRLLCDSLTSS